MLETPEPTTRRLILQVASRLFADRGFHATTTREIADAVGIRQPGLFHHFASKAEIMAELQVMDFSATLRACEVAASLDVSPPAALGVYMSLDVHRLLGGNYAGAATTQPAAMNDPAFAVGRSLYEESVAKEAELIAAAVHSGDFEPVDPAVAATAIEWVVDGVIQDTQRRTTPIDADATVELLLRFALRALIADHADLNDVLAEVRSTVTELDPITWEGP